MIGLEAAAMCLALNMYHEARSEGTKAMMAVAEVTLNRVEDSRFPDDVCSVVYQGRRDSKGNMVRHQCQFSWYCDGKSDKMINEKYKLIAMELATDYLTGLETNITQGATHYHATYVNPYWVSSKQKTTQIKSHIFYIWE
jgi:spore germination cell wall hydrolase CwlJ-like protein